MAAGVYQPFSNRRHDLLVLADEPAVRPDVELCVERRAQRVRQLLTDADDDISIRVARGHAERIRFGAGDFNGVLEQLHRQLVRDRRSRGVMMKPNRVRRNEAFGKADQASAMRPGVADELACFVRRSFSVEKNGGCLNRRHTDRLIDITHQNAPRPWRERTADPRSLGYSCTFIAKALPSLIFADRLCRLFHRGECVAGGDSRQRRDAAFEHHVFKKTTLFRPR
jgi:hypothetical protein